MLVIYDFCNSFVIFLVHWSTFVGCSALDRQPNVLEVCCHCLCCDVEDRYSGPQHNGHLRVKQSCRTANGETRAGRVAVWFEVVSTVAQDQQEEGRPEETSA